MAELLLGDPSPVEGQEGMEELKTINKENMVIGSARAGRKGKRERGREEGGGKSPPPHR